MATINSKQVKRIIAQFIKKNGYKPTLKQLLNLMHGRKP